MTAAASAVALVLPAASAQPVARAVVAAPAAAGGTTTVEHRCTAETPFGSYESAVERLAVTLDAPASVRNGSRPELRWSVDRLPESLPVALRGVSTRTSASVSIDLPRGRPTVITEDSGRASAPTSVAPRDRWPGARTTTFRPRITAAVSGDVMRVEAAELVLDVVAAGDGMSGTVVTCVPLEPVLLAEVTIVGPPPGVGPGAGVPRVGGPPGPPTRGGETPRDRLQPPGGDQGAPAPGTTTPPGEEAPEDESVRVEDVEPPEPRRELIADVRFDTKQRVLAWFGGTARSDVVLRVANVGDVTVSDPSVTVRVGRGPEPSGELDVPPLGDIGVGETVEVRAPVEFGAPAFGEYRVTVAIDGFDEPILVASSTSVYPWALIAIGWLLLQIPLLGLYRRKTPVPATAGRHEADDPVDGFGPVGPEPLPADERDA